MVDVKHPGIWLTLVDLIQAQKGWMHAIAEEFGMTPQMAQALHQIPTAGSITMKSLAGQLWCDASNVTGIVDRLEARGLVVRQAAEHDRRVKCVVLSTAGKRMRRRIEDRFDQSPPAIAALSETDRRSLHAILRRALEHAQALREAAS